MYCCKCNNDLSACVCPDLKERLAKLNRPGTNVFIQTCRTCGEHHGRCKCAAPDLTQPGGAPNAS